MDTKIMNVCRVCFHKFNEGTRLFLRNKASEEILNKLFVCFQVLLKNDGDLPHAMCKLCIEKLNEAHNFRNMCITINERFQEYISHEFKKHQKNIPLETNELTNYEDSQYSFSGSACKDAIEKEHSVNRTKESTFYKGGFKCKICNKVLKSMSSLLKHNISMHEKRKRVGRVTGFGSERRYHCTSCSYTTPHSQTLTNHMRRHNGERPYSCECGKTFTQSSSLAAHRKTHSNTTYFTCSVCGKQFKHAFTLKNHLNVHERGNFSCSICQKVLKSKQSLRTHMQRHYNICNYNCEDCGNTFVTSAELLNHRKKHNVEKKVECHLCGYKTNSKKNLIIHLKRHTGNKAYKCELCQVSFYTHSDLRRHRRVHTREKPFSCPTCSQRFTHSPSLNKHMQTVHGVDYKWGDMKWKQTKYFKVAVKKDAFVA
ncbi:gastrula zinc finger protein XlCGF57.1-like [Manduca sexta]|uniref:gastrula zinc finger protein XlCGF57.1-like n=1 Tax=Manduca sexta TaxID=7130 RepID=UPI00188FE768|nr:gastrula zinc finger protein XlCGF57.1-like [Manduca sexta]